MNITAKCKTGTYIGHVLENNIVEFLGIPYVKPPQRWKKAEPLSPSDKVFEAKENAAPCYQRSCVENWDVAPQMSEDCLTLNVWTADPDVKGKPVLVFIHGGSYMTGCNRTDFFNGIYCGDKFVEASPDIVYVNINYRINIFGCLDLTEFDENGEYKDSSNLQTLDQIAALKWIHENIEGFGGDPENITISGQSAGGMSVAILMSLPEANQYFKRVICQSTALSDTMLKYADKAKSNAKRFYELTGATSLKDLLNMEPETLLDHALTMAFSGESGDSTFEPKWGDGIFPLNPCEELRKGSAKHIDLMIGTVSGEFDTIGLSMSDETLKKAGQSIGQFKNITDDDFTEEYVAHYEERDRRTAYQDFWNDILLRMGSVCTADAHADGGGNTYMYYMSFVPEGAKIRPQHCFEIPYTNMKKDNLAYMDINTNEPVQGNKPSAKLERELHGCWANFVRTGNPNGNHIEIQWPIYTSSNKETAVIDYNWSVENGVRRKDIEQLLPLHNGKAQSV